MIDKNDLKQAFLEMIVSGEIELEIPDSMIHDGLRRAKVELKNLLAWMMENGGFPKDKVQGMLDGRLAEYRSELKSQMVKMVDSKQILRVAAQVGDGPRIETGLQHRQFGDLLVILNTGLNGYLVGPAGSGKTTAGEQAAKALGVDFYFTGAITSEFKLTGFIDANGRVICPAFRKAYEKGGLFLFDEIDGSMAQAVLAFNAAIANNVMDFPDKTVPKHEKFYCVAAANTFGLGADRVYVGRNQLDGATIDRFAFIDWGYDEDLERKMSHNDEWVTYIQKIRFIVQEHGIRHIVSPRASKDGAKLLAAGVKRELVERACLWKGIDKDSKEKIVDLYRAGVALPRKPKQPILASEPDDVEAQVRAATMGLR